MSETVKLIIEIPTGGVFERDIYTPICEDGYIRDEYNERVAEAIKNGIPLDDIKTEIETDLSGDMFDEYGNETALHKELWEILDNIGKGDSE